MVCVHLLGELRVVSDDEEIALAALGRKPKLLLAIIALEPRAHGRSELAGRLWPDVLESSARVSLRTALSQLRAVLGPLAGSVVHGERDGAVALAAGVRTDVADAEALLAAGRAEAAADLCAAELLPGLDDDWALTRRDELRRVLAAGLTDAAEAAEARGDARAAIGLSRRVVALDPLAEAPQRELIRRLAGAGDRAAALSVYARFRDRLAGELRIVPSAATRALADAIRAHDEPAALPSAGAPAEPPAGLLAGREHELEVLREVWERARAGERHVVALCGDPGIGKTRLAAELCTRARASGTPVLSGRCEEEGLHPYARFVEVLRGVAGARAPGALREQLGTHVTPLAALAPDVAEQLGAATTAPQELGAARLVDAIVALVRTAAARPAILLVEDVHWADEATATTMTHLIRATEDLGLLVIVTLRATEVTSGHAIEPVLAHARRAHALTEVPLVGLDEPAVAAMVGALAPGSRDARLVSAVHTRTGGNPFFVQEILRESTGQPSPESLVVPQTVKDVVGRRLRGLQGDVLRLLEIAAVIGGDFDIELLWRTAACSEGELVEGLDAATAAAAVAPASSRGSYAFAHALIRDVIYDGLSELRRAYLHRRVGETLEGRGDRDAGAIARHLSAGGEHERSIPHHLEAARSAARLGALQVGLAHCDAAAASAVAAAADADVPPAQAARIELERARIVWRATQVRPAVTVLERALAAARAAGEDALRLEILVELAHVNRSGDLPRALELLDEALRLADTIDAPEVHVRALSRHAIIQTDQLRLDIAQRDGERALDIARGLGEERVVAQALDALKLVSWQLGDAERLARLTGELEPIQRRHHELWELCFTLLEGAYVSMGGLRWREAEQRLEEARDIGARIGTKGAPAMLLDSRAVAREARGDAQAALDDCASALELIGDTGSPAVTGWIEATTGLVLLRLRAPGRAAAHLRNGLEAAERAGSRHSTLRCAACLARACLDLGDAARAVELAERVERLHALIGTPPGQAMLYLAPALAAAADVLTAAGRPERAGKLIASERAAARGPDRRWYAIPLAVAAARAQATLGRTEEAVAVLAPAVDAWRAGAYAPAWEALAVRAELHRRAGRHDAAAEDARDADRARAEIAARLSDAGLRDGLLRAGATVA